MIILTTLKKSGEVHKQEEKHKRFRPLDGWERQKDGNFIRKLDDPRFISMEEIREKQKEKEKKKEKENLAAKNNSLPIVKNSSYSCITTPMVYVKTPKYTEADFMKHIDFGFGKYEGDVVVVSKATIKCYLQTSACKVGEHFYQIIINHKTNRVEFWKNNERPYCIVHNLILNRHNEQKNKV